MAVQNATRCAWCGKEIGAASTAEDSHGICLDCLPATFSIPVESLEQLSLDRLDALPYGVVVLDADNLVIAYNAFESALARRSREDVLGRRFFVDVAPCTNVEQLAGWIRDARLAAVDAETQLMFVFRFPFGQRLVDLTLGYCSATRHVTIVVRETGAENS